MLGFEAFGASTLPLLAYSPPGWGATLLAGLWNSVQIAVGAFGLGILIGMGGAFGKLYGGPVLKDLLAIYTTVVRAVPELVLILILYFAVTDAVNQMLLSFGYSRIQISGVAAGIAVLGVVQGAYATEVLRGAILSVPSGQIEAARSMGMPPLLLARRITLPLMMAAAVPGLANLWLVATKDTALLAVVGFAELTQATRQAAGTTKAFFTFFMAAGVLYLILSLVSTLIFSRIERWARRGQRTMGR
ncbi:ABC transporter permease subunit [Frigidibacter sp. RF13]|uniref:ABC transporter permease n=1 Tax=Frigidibacter sp. RF13 TaxID=2997340 RepID=UPI0022700C27|nr:ABC transporter permease subunit [Frigidibacter sp. RF13]MCY1125307.1 ABC transporter permease subunit [Frigidibacter sp. RF13]